MRRVTALALAAVGILLAAHLWAEARGLGTVRAATKVGASLGFVAVALSLGIEGRFALGILAGLLLSVAGDALLLSHGRPAFLAGLVAFLLAHVAYALAFAQRAAYLAWPALPLAAVLALVLRWLWPHLGGLRGPVVAYCLVISAMVWLALGVDGPLVRWGAVLFYLSDLAVARDRFVRPAFANRLLGLPLYYGAQVLLALAVG